MVAKTLNNCCKIEHKDLSYLVEPTENSEELAYFVVEQLGYAKTDGQFTKEVAFVENLLKTKKEYSQLTTSSLQDLMEVVWLRQKIIQIDPSLENSDQNRKVLRLAKIIQVIWDNTSYKRTLDEITDGDIRNYVEEALPNERNENNIKFYIDLVKRIYYKNDFIIQEDNQGRIGEISENLCAIDPDGKKTDYENSHLLNPVDFYLYLNGSNVKTPTKYDTVLSDQRVGEWKKYLKSVGKEPMLPPPEPCCAGSACCTCSTKEIEKKSIVLFP